ncbi:phospholipase D family protein [Actinomadura macra]|uniref:phospholipase D family protein n=1 Tax=Actinomadura macra TaxID=46164 RepID=UPI000A7E7887|nr:phospholipase D family protein [Actinomadura macra]
MTQQGFDPQRCGERLLALVRDAEALTVVAPFITVSGIGPLLSALPGESTLEVITRWRPDEVAAGVSDPRVFDLVSQRGGTVALHPVVHAKTYISGTRALVGSANVTANGLGWNRPGAVEILVEVAAEDPALVSLMAALRGTSATAMEADRDAILAAAAMLPPVPLRASAEAADRIDWLPTYRPPEVLWKVYSGKREESVVELVRPELAALGVPAGLTTEEAFDKYIGAILRQGFAGRIARECSNLTTMKAIQRLIELCDEMGHTIDDPADSWETIAAWIAYFLPRYRSVSGGSRLIG